MKYFNKYYIRYLWWLFCTIFVRLRIKKIGLKSVFLFPLFIHNGNNIRIGNRVTIFSGCRIETHNGGSIVIEDNTSIGQNFHITSGEQELCIGKNTTIAPNVFITNIDHDYKEIDKHILDQKYIIEKTSIGENCFIGYSAAIQAGSILGRQCIVGTHSVVRGKFPDYCVIVGIPARIIKRYNFETSTWEKTNDKGDFIK